MKTRVILINDDPTALELQRRLWQAHWPPALGLIIETYPTVRAAILGSRKTAQYLCIDPSSGGELTLRLYERHPHATVICVCSLPTSSYDPRAALGGVNPDYTRCWAEGGAFSRLVQQLAEQDSLVYA